MKKPRRQAKSKEEQRTILAAWRESGQSAARYSEENDLGASCLWRWRREQDGAQPGPAFVRVEPEPECRAVCGGHVGQVEIELPGGPVVRLSGPVDMGHLATFLRSLAGSCGC